MFEGEGTGSVGTADTGGSVDTGSVATQDTRVHADNRTPRGTDDMSLLPAEQAEARRYAGKYERVEALEEAYGKANELIRSAKHKSLDGLTEDDMKARGREQGWYREAPEAYENLLEQLSQAGLDASDLNDPAVAGFVEQIKGLNFTQKQFEGAMKMFGEWITENAMVFGAVDKQAESTKLMKAWGNDHDKILSRVGKFARSNLPQSIYALPLTATAEGMQVLRGIMESRNRQAGGPMTDADRTANIDSQIDSITKRIQAILSDKAYRNPSDPRHEMLHRQHDNLAGRMRKLKR